MLSYFMLTIASGIPAGTAIVISKMLYITLHNSRL
jgi:hypothetical protein